MEMATRNRIGARALKLTPNGWYQFGKRRAIRRGLVMVRKNERLPGRTVRLQLTPRFERKLTGAAARCKFTTPRL